MRFLLLLFPLASCGTLTNRLSQLEQDFSTTLQEHSQAQQVALDQFNQRILEEGYSIEAAKERDNALSAALSLAKIEAKANLDKAVTGLKQDYEEVKDTGKAIAKGVLGMGTTGDLVATLLTALGGAGFLASKKQ